MLSFAADADSENNNLAKAYIEPVSYTHLDVYKRQDVDRCSGQPHTAGNKLHGERLACARGTEAVSYTHLDVYKRQAPMSRGYSSFR